MSEVYPQSPNRSDEERVLWAKRLDLDYIQGQGWAEINKRFHGAVIAARITINQLYKNEPEKREGAFVGFIIAKMEEAREDDIQRLKEAWGHTAQLEGSTELGYNKNTLPPAPRQEQTPPAA